MKLSSITALAAIIASVAAFPLSPSTQVASRDANLNGLSTSLLAARKPVAEELEKRQKVKVDKRQKVKVDKRQKVKVDKRQKVKVDKRQKVKVDKRQKVKVDKRQKVKVDKREEEEEDVVVEDLEKREPDVKAD